MFEKHRNIQKRGKDIHFKSLFFVFQIKNLYKPENYMSNHGQSRSHIGRGRIEFAVVQPKCLLNLRRKLNFYEMIEQKYSAYMILLSIRNNILYLFYYFISSITTASLMLTTFVDNF